MAQAKTRGNYIGGKWRAGGGALFQKTDPSTGELLGELHDSTQEDVDLACTAARKALGDWSQKTEAARVEIITRLGAELEKNREEIALCISQETGKPLWETKTEAGGMIAKIKASLDSQAARRLPEEQKVGESVGWTRYKPQGVCTVLGPYNFPGHLPNGQILPALIAGNTVVFKPSENTPLTGQLYTELWERVGLPAGVMNLVQGGVTPARALVAHDETDAIFFTGSYNTGRAIHAALGGRPETLLVLEMGGNNPLVCWEPGDLRAAAFAVLESAFITAGQRCTCARRLILPEGGPGDELIQELLKLLGNTRYGLYTDDPEPYMGTVISADAARGLTQSWQKMLGLGGVSLLEMQAQERCAALLSPGIMDVTGISELPDEENFGPFLQVIRVPDFETALTRAGATKFGLSAGLLSENEELFRQFYSRIHAGVVNWNQKITGASARLPFGGLGASGNHRPGAFFAADFTSQAVASLEKNRLTLPEKVPPGIHLE